MPKTLKGNKAGIQQTKTIISSWLAAHKLDPQKVCIEYVFDGPQGSPVFGLSEIAWEPYAGTATKHKGEMVARFSASWQSLYASTCNLFGAFVQSADRQTLYGVIDFPGRDSAMMVNEAVSYIREVNVEVWREEGMPYLRHTREGLEVLADSKL